MKATGVEQLSVDGVKVMPPESEFLFMKR